MIASSDNKQSSDDKPVGIWKGWMVIAVCAIAITATIFLTRPAAKVMSMTPLSGLMTLKTMAASSTPYEVALANQRPTLIEFYADWCTTCQSMSATVDALHMQYGEQVNFVMLDIDDPQWADEVEAYRASGVPQFTLLNTHRQSVHTWVGKVPKPVFQSVFDQLLS